MTGDDAQAALSALGGPTRYAIFAALMTADCTPTPTALAERLGLSRNLVSSHLAVLCSAGLVRTSKSGRNVSYAPDTDALRALAAFLEGWSAGHPA